MSRSSMRMVPVLTSSSPATMRRMVDLPEPDPPTSTSNSPSSTRRLKSSTTLTSPNRLVTWSKETEGMRACDTRTDQVPGELVLRAQRQLQQNPPAVALCDKTLALRLFRRAGLIDSRIIAELLAEYERRHDDPPPRAPRGSALWSSLAAPT